MAERVSRGLSLGAIFVIELRLPLKQTLRVKADHNYNPLSVNRSRLMKKHESC